VVRGKNLRGLDSVGEHEKFRSATKKKRGRKACGGARNWMGGRQWENRLKKGSLCNVTNSRRGVGLERKKN